MTEKELEKKVDTVVRKCADDYSKNESFKLLRSVVREHAWDEFRNIWSPYGQLPSSPLPEYNRVVIFERIHEKLEILHIHV